MRARVLAAAALLLMPACGGSKPQGVVTVDLAQGASKLAIRARVAATPDDRTRGLMGRSSLAPDEGMLFVYATPVRIGFWMKDTLIPLDIAFISDGLISEIRSMTPCRANPCPITTPASAYDWALEVGRGTFERAGISPGAVVDTKDTLPSPR